MKRLFVLSLLCIGIAPAVFGQVPIQLRNIDKVTEQPPGSSVLLWDEDGEDDLNWYEIQIGVGSGGGGGGVGGGHVVMDEVSGSALTQRDSLSFSSDFTLTDVAGDGTNPGRTLVSLSEYVGTLFGASGDITSLEVENGDITFGTGGTLRYTPVEGTATGSLALDLSARNAFVYTVTGDFTLDNPTTPTGGDVPFSILFFQDATGGHQVTSWGSKWLQQCLLAEAPLAVTWVQGYYHHTEDVVTCVSQGNAANLIEVPYTRQQYFDAPVAVNATSTFNWDLSKHQVLRLSLETNISTLTFSNARAGGHYTMIVDQGPTGSNTITWPEAIQFPGGTPPTITATAGQVDVIKCDSDGANLFCDYTQAYEPTEEGGGGGDVTAPTITNFAVTNPSAKNVQIAFTANEQITNIAVAISGAESAALDETDFSETDNGNGTWTYTATYVGTLDGTYTATLNLAEDAAGNDGSDGEQDSVVISTGPAWYDGVLVSVWDFNQDFTDSHGSNDLTNHNVTFSGNTASFNGTDAYLSIANANAGDFIIGDEDFTVCAYTRFNVGVADVVVAVSDPVGGAAQENSWGWRYDGDGTGRYWMSTDGSNVTTRSSPNAIHQTWVSTCMSYDASDDLILVSQNGSTTPLTQSHSGGGFPLTEANFTIGAYSNGANAYSGIMDKVWFFNDSITDIEAATGVWVPACHFSDVDYDEMGTCEP